MEVRRQNIIVQIFILILSPDSWLLITMHTGVGIILLNSKNQFLLILRDDKPTIPYPNHWDLPGGHVEPEETPEDCLRREMLEEMELELNSPKLFRHYNWPEFDEYIFWDRMDLVPDRIPLHEGQKVEYYSFDQVQNLKLAFKSAIVVPEFFQQIQNQNT